MFTGLVKKIGIVRSLVKNTEGQLLEVYAGELAKEIMIDDSVAINGVCQTAVRVSGENVWFQAIQTTLEKTSLGQLKINDSVNLELALRLQDRLGGHLVQGHINGMSKIVEIRNTGNSFLVKVHLSEKIAPYMVKEGSVCLDGISLTISNLSREESWFQVSIIPHTWIIQSYITGEWAMS